jgi:hypothetical protein
MVVNVTAPQTSVLVVGVPAIAPLSVTVEPEAAVKAPPEETESVLDDAMVMLPVG